MSEVVYHVSGMTCEHCVRAVTDEIGKLDGVTLVTVDLVAGGNSAVHVASRSPLAAADVQDAVDEAGYELVDSR